MATHTALIIEDFEAFRRFIFSVLQQRAEFQAIHQASDGLEGVQQAEEIQPDLVVLDIALPRLNGIEAARQIRKVSPNSRIVFLTQEPAAEVVEVAMGLGGRGYLLKVNAADELVVAVETVLKGAQFIGRGLQFKETTNNPGRHEVLFCSDEKALLDGFADFLAAALNAGDGAMVCATESHRDHLRQELDGRGVDVDSAIQNGTYIAGDVSEPVDPECILDAIKGLGNAAFRMGKAHPRVAVCGERAGLFWTMGKIDDALHIEKLCNELVESHDVDILCIYPMPQSREEDSFKTLCAQHTAVCYR